VTNVGVPPIRDLAERTTVALGTDNVMLDSPSMFREMEFAAKLSDLPARDPADGDGERRGDRGLNRGVIELGADADLLVLDGDSDNLAGAHDLVRAIVVRRGGGGDVSRVVIGGEPAGRETV